MVAMFPGKFYDTFFSHDTNYSELIFKVDN